MRGDFKSILKGESSSMSVGPFGAGPSDAGGLSPISFAELGPAMCILHAIRTQRVGTPRGSRLQPRQLATSPAVRPTTDRPTPRPVSEKPTLRMARPCASQRCHLWRWCQHLPQVPAVAETDAEETRCHCPWRARAVHTRHSHRVPDTECPLRATHDEGKA